jgi:predicted phosphoribosyltransferase
MPYRDRSEAGRLLAQSLQHYRNQPGTLVLALPRGGVPVAFEVARALNVPLDIFIVRKLGVPGQEELAMGALASGGIPVLNYSLIREANISQAVVDETIAHESEEIQRRETHYRGGTPMCDVGGKTVILVDDGLATGATMAAAVTAIRRKNPARVVVAVPTAPAETCADLRSTADEVVCLEEPEPFYSVGQSYEDFRQTTDEEVVELLRRTA